ASWRIAGDIARLQSWPDGETGTGRRKRRSSNRGSRDRRGRAISYRRLPELLGEQFERRAVSSQFGFGRRAIHRPRDVIAVAAVKRPAGRDRPGFGTAALLRRAQGAAGLLRALLLVGAEH